MEPGQKNIAKRGFKWVTSIMTTLSNLDQVLNENNLPNITQTSILLYLHMHDSGVRIGMLSQDLYLRPNTTTASINILEDRSMIAREKIGNDKRCVNLSLTSTGEETIKTIFSIFDSYFENNTEILDALCDNDAFKEAVADSSIHATYCMFIIEARRFLLQLTYYSRDFSINLSSLRVLSYIGSTHKRQRMIDISSELEMHQNVLSISASQLIDNGYAVKDIDQSDKRAIHLIILPPGRKVYNKTIKFMNELIDNSILSFSKEIS